MTQVAYATPDDLLDTVQIVPRFHDVYLPYILEIESFCGGFGDQYHFDVGSIPVVCVVQCAQIRHIVVGKRLVAGNHHVAGGTKHRRFYIRFLLHGEGIQWNNGRRQTGVQQWFCRGFSAHVAGQPHFF